MLKSSTLTLPCFELWRFALRVSFETERSEGFHNFKSVLLSNYDILPWDNHPNDYLYRCKSLFTIFP